MELLEISQGKDLYLLNKTDLAMDSEASNDNRAAVRGVAISTGYHSKNYRFSEESIRSLVPQAKKTDGKNGVRVHVMHDTWELPIGRTLSATFKNKTDLEVLAYINRDIPSPDTNSIIFRIEDGTIDSLSISWALGPDRKKSYFKNDITGEKMDRGYYMPYDSQGQYPGKRLDDGRIVTATVHGPIIFRELSIVAVGADPRARMLQDTEFQKALSAEFQELGIQNHDLSLISELAGWDEALFSDALSFGIYNPSEEKRIFGGFDMATPETPETGYQAALEWKPKYEAVQKELTELKAETETMVSQEEYDKAIADWQKKLTEKEEALAEAQQLAEDNKKYAAIGESALELARSRATRAFTFYKSNKVDDPQSQQTLKKLSESFDMQWLEKEADGYWDLAGEHMKTRSAEDALLPRTQKDFLKGVEANL